MSLPKSPPTYYQAMVDNNQLGYSKINGEDYFVLTERPYYNTTFTYVDMYRKDWLDELGIATPTNYAEYVAPCNQRSPGRVCGASAGPEPAQGSLCGELRVP